jgi:DnaJ-class molecular chaperone
MNNAATTTICDKCLGKGYIRAFRHIANGDCFACGATGRVDAAKQARSVAVSAPQLEGRMVDIGIAKVWMRVCGSGFQAQVIEIDDGRESRAGDIYFEIRQGQVVDVELTNGISRRWTVAETKSALQSAYRGQ